MEGNTLFPLNVLKNTHPETYAKAYSKYEGRERVTEQVIPTLNCLWNDVLHFSAVLPAEIKQALVDAGMPASRELTFYQINPNLLDPQSTTIYLYAQTLETAKMKPENFEPYVPDELGRYASLPQITRDYYNKMFAKGARPLMYVHVPHILYKGSIDISDAPIIIV